MSFFWQYLRSKKYPVFLYILFGCILMASLALYHLPVEAGLYPLAACAVLGVLLLLWEYFHLCQLHHDLVRMEETVLEMAELLPKAETIPEADYQNLRNF